MFRSDRGVPEPRKTPHGGVLGQPQPLRLSDRLVLGFVSGFMGAILGGALAIVIAFAFHERSIAWSILPASSLYFFLFAAVRGPDAGFFVADALGAVGSVAETTAGVIPGQGVQSAKPSAWGTAWPLAAWLVMVAVLAWRSHA